MMYSPGEWYGLVAESGCVILPKASEVATVKSVWETFTSGVGFAAVLQCVISSSGSNLTDLGPFAVVLIDKGTVHMAVRGPLEVTATNANGSTTVDGRGVATWREESVSGVVSLRVAQVVEGKKDSGDHSAFLPVIAGVVTASEVTFFEDPISRQADREPLERKSEIEPDVQAASPESAEDPETATQGSGSTTLMPETEHVPSDDKDEPLRSTTFFSNLWADAPGLSNAAEPIPVTGFIPPQVSNSDEHDGMTVLGLNSFGPQGGADHDGMTVLDSPDEGAQTSLPYPPPPPTGPVVLARLCPQCGAAHSTRAVACKKCGAALSGDAVHIPRPALGRVQLPDGEIVAIEHPLIVGRRPEAGRFSYSDLPVVVKVDDPHISSTHLKIDLEDWSVLVTNLGRNGTIMRRAGQADRGLSDAEQVTVQVGDQFILGPGIFVTIVELV